MGYETHLCCVWNSLLNGVPLGNSIKLRIKCWLIFGLVEKGRRAVETELRDSLSSNKDLTVLWLGIALSNDAKHWPLYKCASMNNM